MRDGVEELREYPLPLQGRPERLQLYRWIALEEVYVANKFDDQRDGHDASLATYDFGDFWFRQITQYLSRAEAFLQAAHESSSDEDRRVLEMKAQQAIAKCMMTAKGCAESSIRIFGNMPAPGVSSGEIKEWY